MLVGKAELVDGCVARLNELKVKWEAAAEDRERASYSETIEVHQMFHSKIIGQKGATINKLNELHNARVNFPSSRSKELELADVSERSSKFRQLLYFYQVKIKFFPIRTRSRSLVIPNASRL